jgi:hypothetical protein
MYRHTCVLTCTHTRTYIYTQPDTQRGQACMQGHTCVLTHTHTHTSRPVCALSPPPAFETLLIEGAFRSVSDALVASRKPAPQRCVKQNSALNFMTHHANLRLRSCAALLSVVIAFQGHAGQQCVKQGSYFHDASCKFKAEILCSAVVCCACLPAKDMQDNNA